MVCTSAGLISTTYSGNIRVSADVTLKAADDGRGWAGIALNGDVVSDNVYVQAAISDNILPFRAPYMDLEGFHGVILADGAEHCCKDLGSVRIDRSHHIQISYSDSYAVACVDNVCDAVGITLNPYVIELLCVGVDPGESGSNPVQCSFTNIEVQT